MAFNGASTWGIGKQVARSRAESDRAWTTELLLTHVRDRDFQRDQAWVLTRLDEEHSGEAISITQHVDIVNDGILTSLVHYRLIRTWEAIEPFVLAQRARRGSVVFLFFLYRRLALLKADGTPR